MPVLSINWKNIHEHGDAWMQHHALRYEVFRKRCEWKVPVHNGLEFDEFDTPFAQYLVSVDTNNRVRGAMRLLPTTQRYMSEKHWPEMFENTPPSSVDIWEATRFCCDHTLDAEERRACVLELLEACMEFGLNNGICSYLAVMAAPMFPIGLKRNGCSYRRLGPSIEIDGQKTGVAEVPITNEVLDRIRSRMIKAAVFSTGGTHSIAA